MRRLALFDWRGVIVVYPHTSNWDCIVGLFAKWTLGIPLRWPRLRVADRLQGTA